MKKLNLIFLVIWNVLVTFLAISTLVACILLFRHNEEILATRWLNVASVLAISVLSILFSNVMVGGVMMRIGKQ